MAAKVAFEYQSCKMVAWSLQQRRSLSYKNRDDMSPESLWLQRIYKFRQQLKKALNELVAIKAIGSWKIDVEDKVHVVSLSE